MQPTDAEPTEELMYLESNSRAKRVFIDKYGCLIVEHNYFVSSEYRLAKSFISFLRLSKYREYLVADARANNYLRRMASILATKIPVEILEAIIKWLTVATLRERYQVRKQEDLEQMSRVMLRSLIQGTVSNITLVDSAAAQGAVSTYVQIGMLKIIQSITYSPPGPHFPRKGSPNIVPYGRELEELLGHIRHLHLDLTVSTRVYSACYYPIMIFAAQDNLHKLKKWLPSLVSVSIEVDEREEVTYARRLPARGTTRITDELEGLIERMRDTSIQERFVTYTRLPRWLSESERISESGETDMREATEDAIVLYAIANSELEIQV